MAKVCRYFLGHRSIADMLALSVPRMSRSRLVASGLPANWLSMRGTQGRFRRRCSVIARATGSYRGGWKGGSANSGLLVAPSAA